ncbi:MAG: hypothetical protein HY000_31370, partial [Planctomycetes bacterium]|nr:hypothetical protein [Planctomycetota bacterium]
ENQQVALVMITRQGRSGLEFLLIWNDNYGGYFFPVARVKRDCKPDVVAVEAIRADTGYFALKGEVGDVHFSNRFNRERRYLFHLCQANFLGLDLARPGNALEARLARRGILWNWFSEEQLADPVANSLSPTMDAVRLSVLAAARA